MSDFFIISFITGHIYFASARKNPWHPLIIMVLYIHN
jgi:hypothetical protein